MADWVWVESAGTTLREEPRLRTARFGDGYEQRAPDGINHRPQMWDMVFDEVEDDVADEMIDFLRTHDGVTAFSYVPLRSTTAIQVLCKSWSRTVAGPGLSSLRATFEQTFEP